MITINGHIAISNLPPHRGLIVSLAFYEVEGMDSNPPYDGDPPVEAVSDCPELYSRVDLESETTEKLRTIPFTIEHAKGYFYLQVRAILFRKKDEKVYAQTEQFFFVRRPLELIDGIVSVTLPIEWPAISLEELQKYGTIEPRGR